MSFKLIKDNRIAAALKLFICTAIYLIWFFMLEQKVTNDYHVIHVGLDDYIPFCEYFIVPYLLWFAYVLVFWVYFYHKDREIFKKMSVFLFTGMFVSLIICTLYPNGTDFRPAVDPEENIFAAAVSSLYGADTPTNVLPSIHVYNSIGIHIAVKQSGAFRKHKAVERGSLLLCVLICMATLFLKQHSVVDVLVAGFMASVVYGAVYVPESAEGTVRTARRKPAMGHPDDWM